MMHICLSCLELISPSVKMLKRNRLEKTTGKPTAEFLFYVLTGFFLNCLLRDKGTGVYIPPILYT